MSQEASLRALVLRRWDSGESDRRVRLLTRESGRIDVVARGARKSGSRLAAASEPLMLVSVQVATGRRQAYITQAQPITAFAGLRRDYERLLFALAWAELLGTLTPVGQVDEPLFDLAVLGLGWIEQHPSPLLASLWAQVQFMDLEGLAPQWLLCELGTAALAENPAWVSPSAGGYVSRGHAHQFSDAVQVRAEVLIGLSRLGERDGPPSAMKFAVESLQLLHRFWLHHAHGELPSCTQLLRSLAGSGKVP